MTKDKTMGIFCKAIANAMLYKYFGNMSKCYVLNTEQLNQCARLQREVEYAWRS